MKRLGWAGLLTSALCSFALLASQGWTGYGDVEGWLVVGTLFGGWATGAYL